MTRRGWKPRRPCQRDLGNGWRVQGRAGGPYLIVHNGRRVDSALTVARAIKRARSYANA